MRGRSESAASGRVASGELVVSRRGEHRTGACGTALAIIRSRARLVGRRLAFGSERALSGDAARVIAASGRLVCGTLAAAERHQVALLVVVERT